jgi:hypothetical protein
MLHTEASIALIEPGVLREFLTEAVTLYRQLTPHTPHPCFAVLLGTVDNGAARVQRLEFGDNARAHDPAAVEEFQQNIVPLFGGAYENPDRGYWLEAADLLRIDQLADSIGMEILGSIHMHPDWHHIGLPPAHKAPLSEQPTRMDDHVFRHTGWPINLICYLEDIGGAVYYTLQAWGPSDAADHASRPLPTRICTQVEQPTVGVA